MILEQSFGQHWFTGTDIPSLKQIFQVFLRFQLQSWIQKVDHHSDTFLVSYIQYFFIIQSLVILAKYCHPLKTSLYSSNLAGNPWSCDCSLIWLKDFVKSLKACGGTLVNEDTTYCSTEDSSSDTLTNLTTAQFCKCDLFLKKCLLHVG